MSSPIRMSGLVSNLDTESIISALMSVQRTKQTKIENKKTKMEWKLDTWKSLNTKAYSFYTDKLSKMRLQSSYGTKKASSSDESVATITATNNAPAGTHTLQVNKLASAEFVTGKQLTTDENSKAISTSTKLTDLGMSSGNIITVAAGSTSNTLTISDTSTVGDFLTTLKNSGLNASYDTTQKRFFISSKASGTDNAFSLTATTTSELAGLGLDEVKNNSGTVSVASGSIVTLVAPSDASFVYNGAALTSSTNSFTVNGISMSLQGITDAGETVSLTVTNDTQAVYDSIKDFVTNYNTILKEMNTYYYADSASGYDPLTDDQKESMSDDEISKWETKIKDSLLRRDTSLGSLINTMKSNMSQSVTVNGKSYSLSNFGIATSSDYTEKGLLHIDGDEDDSTTANNTDKLMTALNEDPDTVMQVFTQLAGNFYSDLSDSMKSTSLRSTMTFYNDKEIKNTISDYKDQISEMEDKLEAMETRYYKQFSAMETALSNLNSQSSSISSMLGSS